MSLLDRVKKIPVEKRERTYTNDEHIEVALAWANNEVSLTQISKTYNYKSTSNAYLMLARALKAHIIKNKL